MAAVTAGKKAAGIAAAPEKAPSLVAQASPAAAPGAASALTEGEMRASATKLLTEYGCNSHIDAMAKLWSESPWRLGWLSSYAAAHPADVPLICSNSAVQMALTEEHWRVLQRLINARLSPDVELAGKTSAPYFKTQGEIDAAAKEGRLVRIETKHIASAPTDYALPGLLPLARAVDAVLPAGAFKVSSAARPQQAQPLFKALCYPAVTLSNHNFGRAFDIKLTASAREGLDAQVRPFMPAIREMLHRQHRLPTMENLKGLTADVGDGGSKRTVRFTDLDIFKQYEAVVGVVAGFTKKPREFVIRNCVYDETPLFSANGFITKDGRSLDKRESGFTLDEFQRALADIDRVPDDELWNFIHITTLVPVFHIQLPADQR